MSDTRWTKLHERLVFASILPSLQPSMLMPIWRDEVDWNRQMGAGSDGKLDRMPCETCAPLGGERERIDLILTSLAAGSAL